MNLMLDGKVVVVTGGATGIGKSIARAFAEEGCKIAVGARRKEKLDEMRREFESLGYPIFTGQMDVTREQEVAEFSEAVSSAFGRIDVWVNNAGQTCHDRMDEVSLEFWHQVIDTNLTGVFLGSRYAARQMPERAAGSFLTPGPFSRFSRRPAPVPTARPKPVFAA